MVASTRNCSASSTAYLRPSSVGLATPGDETIVLTATEFGRTVQENGSAGTDHGYGSVGLLAGGLLKRASVVSNWPGLATSELYEKRRSDGDVGLSLGLRGLHRGRSRAAARCHCRACLQKSPRFGVCTTCCLVDR